MALNMSINDQNKFGMLKMDKRMDPKCKKGKKKIIQQFSKMACMQILEKTCSEKYYWVM